MISTVTTHVALDTRSGTRYAHADEPIVFSTAWSKDVTRLVLAIDGVNLLTTTSATNGIYVWKPDLSTSLTVTLNHTTCGAVDETLTATFTTERPCVYVDAAKGNDAWDGSSSGLAVKTLARAFALAEAGGVIMVAAGTYAPVTAKGKAVTFRGADGATIDGGGITRCVTADDDVVFENFILQNGYDAEAGGGAYGGTFERCTIRDCHSDWDGGGTYEAVLRNCVIVGNAAENGFGGGAYGGSLAGCVVKNNFAGDAGGVYEPKSLSDTTFSGNLPEDADSVYLVKFAAKGGSGAMAGQTFELGRVYKLPKCTLTHPSGKTFKGWACSNGRRYDDGVLVFDLAKPGETVTMTAIWE